MESLSQDIQEFQISASETERKATIAQWNQLPDFIGRKKSDNYLVVADVSGSMSGNPLIVSISLAMYLSERNTGIFKDAFLTFSRNPQLQVLSGNIFERIAQLNSAQWDMNTNLQATFDLILDKAIANDLPEAEMPKTIVIVSDMQFDEACNNTATEMIERKYSDAGYTMPKIVFWNVNGSVGTNPAKSNSKNVNMVSGYSPNIMKQVLETLSKTPYELMVKTLNSARYESINVK